MAKRKVQPEEHGEILEPEIVEEPVVELVPAPLVQPDEPMQRVTFSLPRSVLIALLDTTSTLADPQRALRLGLLQSGGQPSPLGKLVIAGTDQTALRHKMAAAWRNAHNEELKG